jgi:hypothetical protein
MKYHQVIMTDVRPETSVKEGGAILISKFLQEQWFSELN